MTEDKITWRISKDKFVICKEGVYMALTVRQIAILQLVLSQILEGDKTNYQEDSRQK